MVNNKMQKNFATKENGLNPRHNFAKNSKIDEIFQITQTIPTNN